MRAPVRSAPAFLTCRVLTLFAALLSCDDRPFEVLASETEGVGSIAVDATHVYWLTAKAVRRVPSAGGKVVTFYAPDDISIHDLGLDETHVYLAGTCGFGCSQ